MGMAGQKMDGSIINYCLGFLKTSSRVMYGIHYKIIVKRNQKKHYNKGNDIQDDEEGGHDKECDESDEEDWRIDVEENVQCDGIDDTFSDNEDESLRNRQRITL